MGVVALCGGRDGDIILPLRAGAKKRGDYVLNPSDSAPVRLRVELGRV